MTQELGELLATIPPGPVPDPADLERLLATCWHGFKSDDGGMTGDKLLGRMEEVVWKPPLLSFTIERHGGTVMGSSRVTLQKWTLNLENKTARCDEARVQQPHARQPRLDVGPLADEVATAILHRQKDGRLQWYKGRLVRVLIDRVLPDGSAVTQTLAGRRKRFREALRERLALVGWEEFGRHCYKPRRAVKHEQVVVKVGDFEAEVDVELAPLIKELAKANIVTVVSCQENRPGVAWIMFLSVDDLAEFVNIVAKYDPEEGSLYQRASLAAEEGCWEYTLCPEDTAMNLNFIDEEGVLEECHEGQPCFYFHPSIQFPRTDLPTLLDQMMRHNEWTKATGD
jgi:hypothetical protein